MLLKGVIWIILAMHSDMPADPPSLASLHGMGRAVNFSFFRSSYLVYLALAQHSLPSIPP